MKRLLIPLLFALLVAPGCVDDQKDGAQEVRLTAVRNGTYVGEGDRFPVHVKVEVRVRGGRIMEIRVLEHRQGRGREAEKIVERVLREQSLDVDAVSGATYSSQAILKAIKDALKKGTE